MDKINISSVDEISRYLITMEKSLLFLISLSRIQNLCEIFLNMANSKETENELLKLLESYLIIPQAILVHFTNIFQIQDPQNEKLYIQSICNIFISCHNCISAAYIQLEDLTKTHNTNISLYREMGNNYAIIEYENKYNLILKRELLNLAVSLGQQYLTLLDLNNQIQLSSPSPE